MAIITKTNVVLASTITANLLARFAPHIQPIQSAWRSSAALSLFSLTIYFFWSVFIYPFIFSPLAHLPKPPGGSFINGQFFTLFKQPVGIPQAGWIRNVPNNGLIYYRTLLNGERIITTSQQALREVLSDKSNEFTKPEKLTKIVSTTLGHGVLTAEGEEHRVQKKNLMPAFSYRHVKDLYNIFWSKSRDMVHAMDKEFSSKSNEKDSKSIPIEASEWTSRVTLDIIGLAIMGKSFNALEHDDSELYEAYRTMNEQSGMGRLLDFFSLILPSPIVKAIPVKRNRDIQEAPEYIRSVCRQMIKEKRDLMEKGEASGKDILSVAMNSGGFSDAGLVEQVMTMLGAGHETTATAMTWALYHLCQHPDVLIRLREELTNALPSIRDDDSMVTAPEMDALPYLNAVCSEILRVSPPVPFTIRITNKGSTIVGQKLPAGTMVMIPTTPVNTSLDLWGADADDFDPERWLAPGCANTGGAESNYAYMTFLHGPRSCIGQAFAKAEFSCLVAAWVMAFKFELTDKNKPVEIAVGATRRIKDGLYLNIQRADE